MPVLAPITDCDGLEMMDADIVSLLSGAANLMEAGCIARGTCNSLAGGLSFA
jgi:hypothetical protein